MRVLGTEPKKFEPLEEGHYEYIEAKTGRTDREAILVEYKELFDYLVEQGNPDPESGDFGIPCFSIFLLQNRAGGYMLPTSVMKEFDKDIDEQDLKDIK